MAPSPRQLTDWVYNSTYSDRRLMREDHFQWIFGSSVRLNKRALYEAVGLDLQEMKVRGELAIRAGDLVWHLSWKRA